METPPLPPAPEPSAAKPSRTKLWIGGAAAAALTLGIAVPVMADSGADEPRLSDTTAATMVLDADEMDELEELDGVMVDEIDSEELTDEDIAEINAETDAIVAYLADNGVTVDIETDEDGVRWPAIDDEDDATWELVDQYFEDTYGDEWDELDFELTDEDIAEINAETDAIVAYLADNGVTVDVETDEDGIRWPAIDDEDDATWELVDQYFEDTYGDEWDELDFELTDEDIAEINAETDAIVAYLADNGVTVDVETDEDGVRWPAIDDEDDATWELVDQYFEDTYGEDFELLEGCDFDEDHEFDDDDLDEDEFEDDLDEDELDEDEDEDEGEA